MTVGERDKIEQETRGQGLSLKWYDMREDRFTANDPGKVINSRATTPMVSIVQRKRKMYRTRSPTASMGYGKNNEHIVLQKLANMFAAFMSMCGIFVDLIYGCLTASPDALVGYIYIAEVKCLPSVAAIGLRAATE